MNEFIGIKKQFPSFRNINTITKWSAVLLCEILIAGFAIISPLPVIIFVIAGMAMLILLVKPEYLFFTIVLLIIPGRALTFTLFDVTQYVSHLFVIIVLFFWGIGQLAKTQPQFANVDKGYVQPLLFFGAWALLSLIWSHNRIVGIEDALKLSSAIALVFLIVAFASEPKIFRVALGLFVFVAFIDGMIAFYYPYSNFWLLKRWTFWGYIDVAYMFWTKHTSHGIGGRCMGFAPAHSTAVTLSFALTFCMMFFLVTKSKKRRLMLLGLACFLFAVIVGTLTKSMIISALICTTYVILHLRPVRRRFFTAMIVIFLLVIVSFILIRFQDLTKSLKVVGENLKTQSAEMSETSMGQRLEMAKIGVQKIWETGGMGTGIGGFLQYTPYKKMDGSHPEILWDLGFIGFLLWVWILMGSYRVFVGAIKKSENEYYRRMLIVYLGGYINVLISWLVTFSYADIYLWFYLGIGFALVNLSRTDCFEQKGVLPFSDTGESLVVI